MTFVTDFMTVEKNISDINTKISIIELLSQITTTIGEGLFALEEYKLW